MTVFTAFGVDTAARTISSAAKEIVIKWAASPKLQPDKIAIWYRKICSSEISGSTFRVLGVNASVCTIKTLDLYKAVHTRPLLHSFSPSMAEESKSIP
jgi:hypothetical protein